MGFFKYFKEYVVEKEKELSQKAKETASKVSATLKDSKVYKKAGAFAIATVISLGALTSCANPVTTKYTTLEGQKYKVVMYKGDDACLIPVGKDGKEDNKNTINVIVNEDGVIVDGEFKGSNINSNNNDNTFRVDEGNKVTQVGGKQNSNGSNNQGQTNQSATNSGSTGGTYRVDEGNVVTPAGGNSNSQVVSGGASDGTFTVDAGNVVKPNGNRQETIANGNNSSGASGGTFKVDTGNIVTPSEEKQEPESPEEVIHYTVNDASPNEPSQSYTVGEDEISNKSDEVLTVTVNEDNTIDFGNGR